MKKSIGIESIVFVREARNAMRRALTFSSSVAGTIPRIFFWFRQMSPHTLISMIVPSHAPKADRCHRTLQAKAARKPFMPLGAV